MEFSAWLIAIGLLLVVIHASSNVVARLPLSPAIVYFLFGMALGPWGFDWLRAGSGEACAANRTAVRARGPDLAFCHRLQPRQHACGDGIGACRCASPPSRWWSRSRRSLHLRTGCSTCRRARPSSWRQPWRRRIPSWPAMCRLSDARDRDRLRFGLTGEAGLNDGAAFPFVMLGMGVLVLHDLGPGMWRWWVVDLAWAVAGGLAIGAVLGSALGRWVLHRLRTGTSETGPDAFLGLGLVAVAYGVAVTVDAYGFLAVFAAAVTLQWTVTESGDSETAQHGTAAPMPRQSERALAIASLQRFNSDLESLFEFGVVIMLGVLFTVVPIPFEALVLAIILFFVIRPAAVLIALQGTRLERAQRALAAWFGIRGVGSIYYAMYALNHGWTGVDADRTLGIVLGVVAASIFFHGISVTPLMTTYERQRARVAERKKKPTRERASR